MHHRTIKDKCPYCGKLIDALVSVKIEKSSQPDRYVQAKDMLRESAEEHKDAMYPPNMPKRRRED